MKYVAWDVLNGFLVFPAKNEEDAKRKCRIPRATFLGTLDEVKESLILNLVKKQKIKLAVLVELYGGCFQDVRIFSDPKKASEEQERIAKESGFESAKELLDAVNDGCWAKAEPHCCPEVEIE